MIAFGMHLFGHHLNWWETLLVVLLCPSWFVVWLGVLWDD